MRQATRSQWIKFTLVSIIYILFVFWDYNFWLLLGLPVIFDIYISKVIHWGAWKKSKNKTLRIIGEWLDAIVFALIAVYFIHIFILQNYKIPSSSLEKTLLVGDHLLVSKLAYGPRVPNTPLAMPLVHHTLPILNTKSYSDRPYWEYKRLKGLGEVKRDDIVVFNFPAGDTVALKAQANDYHALVEQHGWDLVNKNKAIFGDIVYRPVDRRENYVKRCIGLPGETLEIKDRIVYIDGKALPTPEKAQFNYFVETHGSVFTDKQFRELEVSKDDRHMIGNEHLCQVLEIEKNANGGYNPLYSLPLTEKAIAILKEKNWAKSIHVEPDWLMKGDVYPYYYNLSWTRDNYGPIWIPKKGETIPLNEKNIALYTRCIVNYENNLLRVDGDRIYINGVLVNSYTFKYDYYWMMGDNRHNSADSRSWGFVPEDHIVGQPLLIWLSLDKDRSWFDGKIRWDRFFNLVKNL
ncbi:signal peptidase I [Bacteroidales bacterium OttesenSCG-928-M11]|nr:signal peptidase I [Bacteroidales bacterium OttesenSCG-928-M11]